MVVRGPFAGFTICDPQWAVEDLEALLSNAVPNVEDTSSAPEDDENFIIEKE